MKSENAIERRARVRSARLLECPFCGSSVRLCEGKHPYRIECDICPATMDGPQLKGVVGIWNLRHSNAQEHRT